MIEERIRRGLVEAADRERSAAEAAVRAVEAAEARLREIADELRAQLTNESGILLEAFGDQLAGEFGGIAVAAQLPIAASEGAEASQTPAQTPRTARGRTLTDAFSGLELRVS